MEAVFIISQKQIIRDNVVMTAIKSIVNAYNDILLENEIFSYTPTEDQRRNQIVKMIKDNSEKYQFKYFVTTESGEMGKDYKTIGRIDICISYKAAEFHQEYLSFECKRFINKKRYTNQSVINPIYEEGIKRYITKKYNCDTGYGGIIAFCESGNYNSLNTAIYHLLDNRCNKIHDKSYTFQHNWIYNAETYDCEENPITLVCILMNFTQTVF